MDASRKAAAATPLEVYRRLLGYARPHWRMFLLGVLGMALSAAVEAAWLWLARTFLDGTFVHRDPATLTLVPVAVVVIFAARGLGDFVS